MYSLPISTPEAQGISSSAVTRFVNRLAELNYVHGFAVIRHGKIIAEGYREGCSAADKHQLFSLSKSFVSSAIGIAYGEGLLTPDSLLVDFFPEYLSDKVTDRMRRLKLRHLLSMSSGHSSCAIGRYSSKYSWRSEGETLPVNERTWVKNFLEDELPFEPGEKFIYNSGATFMLSAVIQRVTGENVSTYLRKRLFDKLGFDLDLYWEKNPEGIDLGGWGFNLSVRELAAFANLWLNKGALNGEQIIPTAYYEEATKKQISNGEVNDVSDWVQGYGFQFWRCRNNCFRGDGYAGQLALMIPEHDAAVVMTGGMPMMQRELDAAFDFLLPEFKESPLPEDIPAYLTLNEATHSMKFDLGPCGEVNPDFSFAEIEVQENAMDLKKIVLLQDSNGMTLRYFFKHRGVDIYEAGFKELRTGCINLVTQNFPLRTVGRCHWENPTTAVLCFAIPQSPSIFTIKLVLDAPSGSTCIYMDTPIWFAHEKLQNQELLRK